MKISAKPFSKPGMVVKKKFELSNAGPTDQDLKVMAEIEKAEKQRLELAEENRKATFKPQPIQPRGPVKPYENSGSKFGQYPDQQQSAASLKKVQEDFVAPMFLQKAVKQDVLERRQNPSSQQARKV